MEDLQDLQDRVERRRPNSDKVLQESQIDSVWTFPGFVYRVVDGDTFDAVVDLGHKNYSDSRYRLSAVDTTEIRFVDRTSEEYKSGIEATKFVIDKILGEDVAIHTFKAGSFGRYLAKVELIGEGPSLNEQLLEADLGEEYSR